MRHLAVLDTLVCGLLASGMTGCGENNRMQPPPDAMLPPPDAGGDGMQPPPDAGGDIIVRGTFVDHFVTDTGVVDIPSDLSRNPSISVLVPTASGFDTHAGTGAPDGSFMVDLGPAAPPWQLELTYGAASASPLSVFFIGNATQFTFGAFALGRPDQAFPSSSTHVTLNVNGLSSWQATDGLEIVSSNVGAVAHDVETQFPGFPTTPTPGVTAISNVTIPWFNPLIDATKGDAAMVYQLVTGTGPVFTRTLGTIGQASPITMVDGGTATMMVTLSRVALDRVLTVHLKRSLFDAFHSQVGPAAGPPLAGRQNVIIQALPGIAQRGFFGVDDPFLAEALLFDNGTTDLDLTFTYGNPFKTGGASWDDFVRILYPFNVPVMAPGSQVATSVEVGFTTFIPVAAFPTDGTIAPVLSPVRSVQIGGMDLMAPRTAVGLTPTVTWDPPALGTPTAYLVKLDEVTTNAADPNHKTVVNEVADFSLTSTTLHIPPSLLVAGHSYMLVIDAELFPGADLVAAPGLTTGVAAHHHATVATAQFTP
jgi:hypothetical protein